MIAFQRRREESGKKQEKPFIVGSENVEHRGVMGTETTEPPNFQKLAETGGAIAIQHIL